MDEPSLHFNWVTVSEAGFRLSLPASTRRQHVGPLYRGRLSRLNIETELIVMFDANVDANKVETTKFEASRPPPITEWNGFKWTYHQWGASTTRQGGYEYSVTQTAANRRGRSYRWGITIPVNDVWIELDISNGYGGLEWDQFKAISRTIIRSVEVL